MNRCVKQCVVNKSMGHSLKVSIFWSEELKLKQQLVDIHNLWIIFGKPRMGTINDERSRVKGLYKKCFNTHKKELEVCICE